MKAGGCVTLSSLNKTESFNALLLSDPRREFDRIYTSDLLSDVLARCPRGALLVTCISHQNTLALAFEKELAAVVFVHNAGLPKKLMDIAGERRLNIFSTPLNQAEASFYLQSLLKEAE
jgi:hypothetical protein